MNNKRQTRVETEAAIRVQKVVRGHKGRERAMAVALRKEHLEKQREKRLEAARFRRARAMESHGMTSNDAATRIQAAARGRQGRRRAKKVVRPFEFSLGGLSFKHTVILALVL